MHVSHKMLGTIHSFIDGTVMMPICRTMPLKNQREVYNGHIRIHALKYQSIVLPKGLVDNLSGPMEGRRDDATLFVERLRERELLCLYGDSAYPLSPYLMYPYKNTVLTDEQKAFNTDMSSGWDTVESDKFRENCAVVCCTCRELANITACVTYAY